MMALLQKLPVLVARRVGWSLRGFDGTRGVFDRVADRDGSLPFNSIQDSTNLRRGQRLSLLADAEGLSPAKTRLVSQAALKSVSAEDLLFL